MNNKIILLLVIIGFASAMKADSFHNLWSAWKSTHKRTYHASEELTRFGIFIENVEKINRLNAENSGVKFAINKFADLTATEFTAQYTSGYFPETLSSEFIEANSVTLSEGDLPASVDWRNKGAVTPVKDVGKCGASWAFSAIGLMESFYFIHNGKLVSFSEQQLVDCDYAENMGCSGGLPYRSVYWAASHGLETEADYPYTGLDYQNCTFDQSKAVQNVVGGYKFVSPKTKKGLKTALVDSPVSVVIEADQDTFQFYKSGVIWRGCNSNVNHAVLAVGYQKFGADEAYIVKNSWGTSWGQDGYVYISTDGFMNVGNGVCGILVQPVVAY